MLCWIQILIFRLSRVSLWPQLIGANTKRQDTSDLILATARTWALSVVFSQHLAQNFYPSKGREVEDATAAVAVSERHRRGLYKLTALCVPLARIVPRSRSGKYKLWKERSVVLRFNHRQWRDGGTETEQLSEPSSSFSSSWIPLIPETYNESRRKRDSEISVYLCSSQCSNSICVASDVSQFTLGPEFIILRKKVPLTQPVIKWL